jgi:hypothetical protein
MLWTQVQIPEELYEGARRLAERREISLEEILQGGLELLLATDPVDRISEWNLELPPRTHSTQNPFENSDCRWQANVETDTAPAVV